MSDLKKTPALKSVTLPESAAYALERAMDILDGDFSEREAEFAGWVIRGFWECNEQILLSRGQLANQLQVNAAYDKAASLAEQSLYIIQRQIEVSNGTIQDIIDISGGGFTIDPSDDAEPA